MRQFKAKFILALALCPSVIVLATPPQFGEPASALDIASHNTMIFPDGENLPPGSGGPADGEALFAKLCVVCHGPGGRGGPGGELAGGSQPLDSETPDKTIGLYWPYATTLFDFIRRSMPLNKPGSLTDDEVYALTAYLLVENGVVEPGAVLDAESVAKIVMPNRNGFIGVDAAAPAFHTHSQN